MVCSVEWLLRRVRRGEEVGECFDHLADDALAFVSIEGWIERVNETVVGLAATFPLASGVLIVCDVVGDDRVAVVLCARKDLVVADPRVAARVRRLVDRDRLQATLAQLECDRRCPHLVQQQPHAAD